MRSLIFVFQLRMGDCHMTRACKSQKRVRNQKATECGEPSPRMLRSVALWRTSPKTRMWVVCPSGTSQWHHMPVNILSLRQDGRHLPDDIFTWPFLNENVYISIKISLKFVLIGPINNIPSKVQIMAWRLPGTKPLTEPMMVSLLAHICVTRLQWVKTSRITSHSTVCWTAILFRLNNENIKLHISGPLWGDSPHKGPVILKALSCHDVSIALVNMS